MLTLFWMPALPPAGQAIGSGLYGMSAPTKTATTPGIAFAADRVDRADVGVRVRAAQDGHVGHRRQLDVVEIVAVAGDEARVLDPLDRFAEDVGGHRGASSPYARRGRARAGRIVSAAARIAATMFW